MKNSLSLLRIGFVLAFALSLISLASASEQAGKAPAASGPLQVEVAPQGFTGAGSCASSSCHGSVWPRSNGPDRIAQNEYQVWSTRDRHAKSYAVLLEPRSKQIARNLRIERPETAEVCLSCHAVNAPAARRAATFDLSDGVSCEGCHGPASGWLGQHVLRDWKHERSLTVGMIDTRTPATAVTLCLSCHLGNEQKTVDHELIAAGHPDLLFEFETFTTLMPMHWRADANAGTGIRRWGLSQILAMRESMKQLARRASSVAWEGFPEFSDFECSSCHHDLVVPSARQERGYRGRAGVPPWDESRYVVFRHLIERMSPERRRAIDTNVTTLRNLMQSPHSNRSAVSETALRIAGQMDALLPLLESSSTTLSTGASGNALMRLVVGDAKDIAGAGAHSAAQAAMAVDVFYRATGGAALGDAAPLNKQINVLYGLLQSDSRYNPTTFANELGKLRPLIPAAP